MIETIISNNCTGGAVMHELGMEFKSPTINLQILPEEYTRFCLYLKKYMNKELIEYKNPSEVHIRYLNKMFGGVPDMPLGLLGDIVVCFQHYGSFREGLIKWNQRKAKIDYDHIGYIFHARGPEYRADAELFSKVDLPNKLILTQNFSIDDSVSFDGEGFSAVNGKLLITQIYDYESWRDGKC